MPRAPAVYVYCIFMPHQWAAFSLLKDTKEISLKQRLQKELAANDESLFEYV